MAGRLFSASTTTTTSLVDLRSSVYSPLVGPTTELYLTVTSTCTCVVQMEEAGGLFYTYPELTFAGPTAQLILVKRGGVRLVIQTATQTNVELFW